MLRTLVLRNKTEITVEILGERYTVGWGSWVKHVLKDKGDVWSINSKEKTPWSCVCSVQWRGIGGISTIQILEVPKLWNLLPSYLIKSYSNFGTNGRFSTRKTIWLPAGLGGQQKKLRYYWFGDVAAIHEYNKWSDDANVFRCTSNNNECLYTLWHIYSENRCFNSYRVNL